ncbi:MAG: hypothetical protein HC922_02790 [Leptolyngbyaceae cyanobacterium SM2_3_12]|nr:hypothetical protein [Leptolyngbyaceae cyanobacterium SM2_3_12]
MFQSQMPDAQASNVPSAPESAPTTSHREAVRHLLFGSPQAVDRTIKKLHVKGYADPNDWSHPMPTGRPQEVMVILTTHLLIEG